VTFWTSPDGKTFLPAGTVANDVDEKADGVRLKDFSVTLSGARARYVKVIARNRGNCPEWHPGAGSKAWIFADEITIE
jgi:hypothetical protein